jgi:hypothetical protein
LPEEPISMKYLVITKPIKIIGQPNCLLEITEGPIIIKINENYDNEVVKFSQVQIQFDINLPEKSRIENENTNSKLTFLFKIYPGSLVEIEDCDITCTRENDALNNKLICFLMKYCPYQEFNSDLLSPNITILTIISSRIEKFYQTIRAGENCIINIEKSFINKNIGKPIAVLNPLIIKVVGSIFENNGDNAIHVKFVKDENLINDSRKLFFNNNEFLYNNGCGIFLDGIENFVFDLDIRIDSNLFKRNAGDGIFFMDVLAKSLIIQKNKFMYGKMNGLNFQKVYQKVSLPLQGNSKSIISGALPNSPNIDITENQFIENDGYGIFLSDTKSKISLNNFVHNGMGGILLVNINNNNTGNSNSANNSSNNQLEKENNYNSNSAVKSTQTHGNTSSMVNDHNSILSYIYTSPGTTALHKNSFLKNGGSGLKIVNYNNFVSISECVMKENIEFGIYIEVDYNASILNAKNAQIGDTQSSLMEKIKSFQSADNSKIPKETNIYLHNSSLINNMKSGLFLNNCFAFLENTIIGDNLDFSIYTPKQQFVKCFRLSKISNTNLINGNIGGPWGEISTISKTFCSSCTESSKVIKTFNKTILPQPNVNNEQEEKHKNLIENEKNMDKVREPNKMQFQTENAYSNRNKNSDNNNAIQNNNNPRISNENRVNSNDTNINNKKNNTGNSDDNDNNKCRII